MNAPIVKTDYTLPDGRTVRQLASEILTDLDRRRAAYRATPEYAEVRRAAAKAHVNATRHDGSIDPFFDAVGLGHEQKHARERWND